MVDIKYYRARITFICAHNSISLLNSDQQLGYVIIENHKHRQITNQNDQYHDNFQPKMRKKIDEGTRKRIIKATVSYALIA